MQQDMAKMRSYGQNGQVFRESDWDGNESSKITILRKVKTTEGSVYQCEISGSQFKTIDQFEPINDDLLEKLRFLDEQL